MTRTNLARLGGLAAVLGGLLAVAINTLNFVLILSTDPSNLSHAGLSSCSWSSWESL